MSTFDPSDYIKEVRKASHIVARSYMKFEPEDIAQAILLDMCAKPKRYNGVKGNLLFKVITRTGYLYCQDQASRLLHTNDEYTYSSEEVKQLLYRFYDPGNWPNGWQQPVFDSEKETVDEFSYELEMWAEHTRINIDMFDIQSAVGKLRAIHRRVIEKKYRDQESLTRNEQTYHGEAIRLMTYFVNESSAKSYRDVPWDYEGPGARRALSNAQAQNLTNLEY